MRMTINTFEVHERYFQRSNKAIRVDRARKPNSRTKQAFKFDNIHRASVNKQRSVSLAEFKTSAIAEPAEVTILSYFPFHKVANNYNIIILIVI